ncbi:MAG: segregation and condensation protein A [Acidobacteriota bacterium]
MKPEASLSSESAASRTYRFVLGAFEGPLDLLLHLIRVNEVEITDIPVAEIARQYDEMLDLMREMNLEIAGEFLVMAATLIYIKSRMLLPVEQERVAEGMEEDPRTGLVNALLEHQRYREVARDLEERERRAGLVFTHPAGPEVQEEGRLEVSLFDLVKVFHSLLQTAENRHALVSQRDEISLDARIRQILLRLENEDSLLFQQLLEERFDVAQVVVTFLAVLELVRKGSVKVYQRRPFEEIRLLRNVA